MNDHTPVLGDLRAFSEMISEPPGNELRAAMPVPEAATPPQRYALLTRPELRRLAQMIELLAPHPLEFRAFTDEVEAIAWLQSTPDQVAR
jgi:hypothetical protein